MKGLLPTKKLAEEILSHITADIVENFQPDKIILLVHMRGKSHNI
jgi:hypothetical protein